MHQADFSPGQHCTMFEQEVKVESREHVLSGASSCRSLARHDEVAVLLWNFGLN